MNIHPKQLEELLKLRFMDSVGLFPERSSTSVDGTSESEFLALLESLIQSNGLSEGLMSSSELTSEKSQYLFNSKLSGSYSILNVTDYDQLIEQSSTQYGVDPNLIRAVIQTESGYKSDAVSESGAKGLMQLMDATAASLGVKNSYDPQDNINGGTKFLAYLLQKYNGHERVALAAYNAGPGRIDRLGISNDAQLQDKYDELPQETQNYIRKVMGLRND
ncbi:MAG: lytic transglycosylase domain-containing protein [Paenibacillaceae bacterium]